MSDYVFTAAVTLPDGRSVAARFRVPPGAADDDVFEHAELAANVAVNGASMLKRGDEYKARRRAEEAAEAEVEKVECAEDNLGLICRLPIGHDGPHADGRGNLWGARRRCRLAEARF